MYCKINVRAYTITGARPPVPKAISKTVMIFDRKFVSQERVEFDAIGCVVGE